MESQALVDALHSWQKCSLGSISASGFSLKSDWNLPLGTRVEVYFELPTAIAIETEAELVRIGRDELGFRFVDLSLELQGALESYVALSRADEPLHEDAQDPAPS